MTFQYFFGVALFAFIFDYFVMVVFEGLIGIFYRMNGDRMIKTARWRD
jgi:hypothetical protein